MALIANDNKCLEVAVIIYDRRFKSIPLKTRVSKLELLLLKFEMFNIII